MTCKAKQYSDTMICDRCALQWDINDPEPPECLIDEQINNAVADKTLGELKGMFKDAAD